MTGSRSSSLYAGIMTDSDFVASEKIDGGGTYKRWYNTNPEHALCRMATQASAFVAAGQRFQEASPCQMKMDPPESAVMLRSGYRRRFR